ncbi:beta-N-acetylhexosaminidase [Sulfurovum sp. CS9]|uniref:beta-N-acetylhexosaminidase n=1 Tax=Sulfurovum sp. CS9 TaxID=3391146 RepID=UPI0039EB66FE
MVMIIPLFLIAGNSTNVIIPKPQKLLPGNGKFLLTKQTRYLSDTSLSQNAIAYLQRQLKQNAGYLLQRARVSKDKSIRFHYDPKKIKKSEAYRLHIEKEQVTIEARDKAGFFYAVVSLMQLMDPAIWGQSGSSRGEKNWYIPSCTIEDYPRFKWRGMMLDTSRNFFSTSYIKKFIDRMAQHKLNRFHWHLTDDEGWRIQIKQYPLLTKIGARRGPGTKLPFSTYPAIRGPKNKIQSGYYTQDEIREIVAYAKARSIEILPEIDIPGHAKAAIVAYPKLLQDPKDKSRYRSVQKVTNNTINPGMESSYIFLENVISEVSGLFPFHYIHLGGDEIPKGAWKKSPAVHNLMQKKGLKNTKEVQNYFFTRLDKILAKHQRKMIVWQEVMQGKPMLRQSDIFMAWKSPKAGRKLIKQHRNVIMVPVQYLYFDQQYTRSKKEPGHTWSTPVSTQKTYTFNPGNSSYIRGVQACLWSETLLNEKIADYLAWPRTLALSEVAWTEQKKRKWGDFQKRASEAGLKRLKEQGIHYRPVVPVR